MKRAMSLNSVFHRNFITNFRATSLLSSRCYGIEAKHTKGKAEDMVAFEEEPQYEKIQDDSLFDEKRNKSRLRDCDRRRLNNLPPFLESIYMSHDTLRYKRRMLGRYGLENLDVTPGVAWPTARELYEAKEFEKFLYPRTMQEILQEAEQKRKQAAEKIIAREKLLTEKLEKMEKWKLDLATRLAKKEANLRKAKEERERLVESVRRHFGYSINPKDARFKEMLELKEKEQKKLQKEQKKKDRAVQIMQKFLAQAKTQTDETAGPDTKEDPNAKADSNTAATKKTS